MRPRVLVLPISAAIIAGLVAYKMTRHEPPLREIEAVELRPAPESRMIGLDGREFRLKGMLGRHRILLAFFDGAAPLADEPLLRLLREKHGELRAHDIETLVVSDASPATYKAELKRADVEFPFRLLSDLRSMPGLGDQLAPGMAQSEWRVPDLLRVRSLPIVFLIDRAGRTRFEHEAPRPLDDPPTAIRRLAAGADE